MPDDLKELASLLGIHKPWLIKTPTHLKAGILEKNWRHWPIQYGLPSNSQVFGRLLNSAGFEGVHYPSTKGSKNCVAIYLQNLVRSESYIELMDEPPNGVHYTRLNSDSWSKLI